MEGRKLETTVYNPGPQTYEAQLVPRIFRPWAERLVGVANLMAGERVLDLACGSGIVARTAVPRVHVRTHISEIRFGSAGEMLNALTGAHAPVAGAIAALDDEIKEALYREMAEAFATYADDDGVLFPMTGAVVVARK